MSKPYGVTLFCDDIRQEVNGKTTLVGVYGPELIVLGEDSVTMPILALSMRLLIPPDLKFKNVKIVISLQSGSESKMLAELDEIKMPDRESLEKTTTIPPEGAMALFNGHVSFSPFVAIPNDVIRVRAYIDDLEVRMGSLKVTSTNDHPNFSKS